MPQELPDRLKLYHFTLDRLLGKGGTGQVYRGIDTGTGQVVAIKLFHANFFRNRGHIRDLAKAVDVFKKFTHQNLVRMFDFIEGDEGVCLVMEYVDGPDLKWYIDNRPWNLQERLIVVAQICNGLQYLHDQKFVHHDLKPANVLFTRKGMVKITDYSLSGARSFSFFDFLGSGLAEQITPMYVSPEIIKREKATPQSDIYSLGITLYLLFTGRVPFEVDSLQKLYTCHLKVMPDHPSTVNPKCPHALGDIILKMISKDPAARYENLDQLRIKLSTVGQSRI